MKKLKLHLWYKKDAINAAEYYTKIFRNSGISNKTIISNTPSDNIDRVSFYLEGLNIEAISAKSNFKFNRSSSLMVYCETEKEIKDLWDKLLDGGHVVIPLEEYPFSKHYGWLEDKFGLSWQVIQVDKAPKHKIKPFLTFSAAVCGEAEAALKHYTKIFKYSEISEINEYEENQTNSNDAKISYAEFNLRGLNIAAMDDSEYSNITFNEAFSFIVMCDTQREIDYYWNNLSSVPEAEQCGWLKDKYGLSWQIIPIRLSEMMINGTNEQKQNVTKAFLKMKKFNIGQLEEAYKI